MPMIPISAVVITFNEEKKIERCLSSLVWADEILVVDAESADKTREICQSSEAPWAKKLRFLSKVWNGFREQRNFAMNQAKNDWIFVLDADEECSLQLSQKIMDLFLLGSPPQKAFKIKRAEYFLGKQIHFGVWNPSYQDRLFHRSGVEYVNDVHEYPRFRVTPDLIHEPILHWPDFGPIQFLEKMNKYTTIEARERVSSGQRTNWFRLLFAFPAMFYKNYFYYRAYKDGMHGFVISLLEGVSRVVRHVKIWAASRE